MFALRTLLSEGGCLKRWFIGVHQSQYPPQISSLLLHSLAHLTFSHSSYALSHSLTPLPFSHLLSLLSRSLTFSHTSPVLSRSLTSLTHLSPLSRSLTPFTVPVRRCPCVLRGPRCAVAALSVFSFLQVRACIAKSIINKWIINLTYEKEGTHKFPWEVGWVLLSLFSLSLSKSNDSSHQVTKPRLVTPLVCLLFLTSESMHCQINNQ